MATCVAMTGLDERASAAAKGTTAITVIAAKTAIQGSVWLDRAGGDRHWFNPSVRL
jgi:hypothetical protein